MSADAETRRQAFVRERALLDEASAINAATEKGIEIGVEKGTQNGKREEAIAILARLLEKRFGPLTEETRTHLFIATLEQLEFWADRILEAPSMTAVFLSN